jgi:Asp-tRNA(Asn)/Glu-tRNA(Gln) amidotransferase C subunit
VSLDKDQVQQIAVLARLSVKDDEFAETVDESDDRDHIQENAPSVEGGLYLVPKVIE